MVSQSTPYPDLSSLYCGLSLPVPGRSNGREERKTLQYFWESKENEMNKHIREKRIRETGLFTSCPHETTAGGILLTRMGSCPNSICRFVLFLHLVVKPLGMNVTIFP